MRNLDGQHRINVHSLPEIHRDLGIEAMLRHQDFPDRPKLKPVHIVNALVLYYLKSMTPKERHKALATGLAELDRLQALDEPEPPAKDSPDFEPRRRFVPPT